VADRRRESDSLEIPVCQPSESLKSGCELDASTIVGELVDLIHDDVTDILEMTLHDFSRQNRLQGLRGSNQQDWRGRSLLSTI